jgi:hypothetical protein
LSALSATFYFDGFRRIVADRNEMKRCPAGLAKIFGQND